MRNFWVQINSTCFFLIPVKLKLQKQSSQIKGLVVTHDLMFVSYLDYKKVWITIKLSLAAITQLNVHLYLSNPSYERF